MKFALIALLSLFALNAHASRGFPSAEEMNKVTIQKVRAQVEGKSQVAQPFDLETVQLNNKYLVKSVSGCVYSANVAWDQFGWPHVQSVQVKLLGCN